MFADGYGLVVVVRRGLVLVGFGVKGGKEEENGKGKAYLLDQHV